MAAAGSRSKVRFWCGLLLSVLGWDSGLEFLQICLAGRRRKGCIHTGCAGAQATLLDYSWYLFLFIGLVGMGHYYYR